MPKIHLSIDPNYCSDWKFFEGVRELIQNAKDAEEYDNLPMTIEHRHRSNILAITTKGVSLEAGMLLLLGRSSKTSGGQRGKFGEGFALGCLALVRAGHEVTIYNGGEVWRPEISKAEDGPFAGSDTFAFNTRALPKYRHDFTVEIEGVTKEIWEAARKLFLFLEPPNEKYLVKVSSGTVIMDPAYQGLIYARGIFVMRNDEMEFGYDLVDAELDRDRRMIEEWNLKYKLSQVWEEAHRLDPEKMAPRVYQMAKDNKPEVHSLHYRMDARLAQSLRAEFEKEHGEDTVAVSSVTEARDLDRLGAKTAMVPQTLQQLLAKAGPALSEIKDKLRGKVKLTYDYKSLTDAERDTCFGLVEIVTQDYVIVDFCDDTLCRSDRNGPTLYVSRELLHRSADEVLQSVGEAQAKRSGVPLEKLLIKHIAEDWRKHHPASPAPSTVPPPADTQPPVDGIPF